MSTKTVLKLPAKILIGAILLGGLFAYLYSQGYLTRSPGAPGASASGTGAPGSANRIVVGVNDFGGAYPGVVANDGTKPGPNSKFTAAGLNVEFKLIRGSKERLQAFDDGSVDVMLLSLDYLANLAPSYKEKGVDVKAFLMTDWSRGNLGLVVKPNVRSIEDLKGVKIVTTRNTPTHYFLLYLLKRSNLSPADVDQIKSDLVFAAKTPQAGEMFQRGEADAVAIWEPHLSQAAAKGKVLVSTSTATNLVADVLFAKADFLASREADMSKFVRAWFEGVKAIEQDKKGSVAIIAKAFEQSEEETNGVLSKIKPASFADNRAFFGMDTEASPFSTLFDDATRVWQAEGVIKKPSSATSVRFLKPLEAAAKDFASEHVNESFNFASGPGDAAPLLTKSVSVYFLSGGDQLDASAKQAADVFASTVSEFGNAYVRVEGNTDNEGKRDFNVALSKRRAESLINYLVKRHGFDRQRFVSVGNGPDNPVTSNATPEGREKNRRTDFKIIPNSR